MIRNGTDSFPRSIPALTTHPTRGTSTSRFRLCYEPPHPSNLTHKLPTSFLAFNLPPVGSEDARMVYRPAPSLPPFTLVAHPVGSPPFSGAATHPFFLEFSVLDYSVRKKKNHRGYEWLGSSC